MTQLFIPKKIKVGFQERNDTYTGKLAYVVFVDNKGVLRKQKSFDEWRDNKIPVEEYDNLPQDGFCLNKNIKRYGWSHFGSNSSYIRVYDPRGVEFEITPENLIGILTETDCLKRGLDGKFVYAWSGTNLVLLPCGSEEYKKAVEHTKRQDMKISTKDLKEGCVYTTKQGETVIYIGKCNYYSYEDDNGRYILESKKYIFAQEIDTPRYAIYGGIYNEKETIPVTNFLPKSSIQFLASKDTEHAVANYAELVDKWNQDRHSSKVARFELVKPTDSCLDKRNNYFFDKKGTKYTYILNGHTLHESGTIDLKTGIEKTSGYYSTKSVSYSTKEKMMKYIEDNNLMEGFFVLENGNKINHKDYSFYK